MAQSVGLVGGEAVLGGVRHLLLLGMLGQGPPAGQPVQDRQHLGAHVGREPRQEVQHPVVPIAGPYSAAGQLLLGAVGILGGQGEPIVAADPGQLRGGELPGQPGPEVLVLGRRHLDQQPHLVQRELAAGERGTDLGQRLQGLTDPHQVPPRAEAEAAPDRQPVGKGADDRVRPAGRALELGDEPGELARGGVDVRGQLAHAAVELVDVQPLSHATILPNKCSLCRGMGRESGQ